MGLSLDVELMRRLGIEPPCFSEADRPELFACWRDRVLLALSQFERGQDASEMIREAQVYGGRVAPARDATKFAQANARLDDFFGRVIPGILLELSEPEGTA